MLDFTTEFNELAQDVLVATKSVVQQRAPGLPVEPLAAFLGQMGGRLYMSGDKDDVPKDKDANPFRLCVTTKMLPDFEAAAEIVIVDEVIGWK
jgi:hypothetical protein